MTYRMNQLYKTAAIAGFVAAALTLGAPAAHGESTSVTGAGALSSAPCCRLDFAIVIPRVLRFRVGTAGGTIDQVTFTVPAANAFDGTVISGTGGDAGGGAVNVSVVANTGQVTVTETNNSGGSGLQRAGGGTISYATIATASGLAALPAPTLSDAGGGTALPTLNAGNVTNRTTTWTYTYSNPATVVEAGTYGAGGAGGGRVTYTATTP
jgi:hypothetical protein